MKLIKAISNIVPVILWMFLFHSSAFAVVTDSNALFLETNIPKPAYLQSYIEPAFDTKITRISGNPATNQGDVIWGDVARHHYSKDQAWNADMSLLLIRNKSSLASNYLILDGSSYAFKFALDFSANERRWSPVDANLLFYTKGNKFYKYNVYSKEHSLIRKFSEYRDKKYALSLRREGNLSWDGAKIAFSSKTKKGYEVYSYDINNDRKSSVLNVGKSKPKWISISASGKYVVIFWGDKKSLIYNASDMSYVGRLPYNLSHYDLAVDVDGSDVAVGVEKPGAGGRVIKQKLSDGAMTVLIERGYAAHTSTRNINRPGWAYVSYHTEEFEDRKRRYAPFYSEVVAVKMDGSGEVERYGHFRNDKVDYKTEPHASPSPDGTKIIFASNWNNSYARPVQSYVIETGAHQSQEGNLIKNSDFESGFTSWSQNQPVEIILDEESGTQVAKMGGSGGSAGLYQYINVSEGSGSYSFSMKYKFAGRSCNVYISFYNDKTKVSTTKIALPYASTYTLISGDIPAPATYNKIRLYIYKGTSGASTIYADDVKLTK